MPGPVVTWSRCGIRRVLSETSSEGWLGPASQWPLGITTLLSTRGARAHAAAVSGLPCELRCRCDVMSEFHVPLGFN